MENVTTAISTLGFPIVMCLIFVVAIKYLYDSMKAQNDAQAERHTEEVKVLTEALNNNTLVLQKLCDTLNNTAQLNLPEHTADGTGD